MYEIITKIIYNPRGAIYSDVSLPVKTFMFLIKSLIKKDVTVTSGFFFR
jgi:hypothetical protein